MNRALAILVTLSILMSYASDAFPRDLDENSIWVEICGSGDFIRISLGDEDEQPPLQAPHNKICHAVCCQNEDECLDDGEDSHPI